MAPRQGVVDMRRLAILITAVLLAACSSAAPGPTSSASGPAATALSQGPTTSQASTPTWTPPAAPTPMPTPTPAPLADRLSDPDPAVRLAAVQELAGLNDPTTVAALVDASQDPDQDVAVAAIAYLGSVGGPESTTALLALAKTIPDGSDADASARFEAAVTSLNQVHGTAAVVRLLEIAVAEGAGNPTSGCALTAPGPADVTSLAKALGHADAAVRLESIACLAVIGDTASVDLLVKQIASTNATVRAAAISTLGDVGSTRATSALIKALGNSKTFDDASSALAQIYDADATPLLKYLKAAKTVKVYAPIIRIGQAGTESALITALNKFGYKDMAVDYLNCGSAKLDKAAHTWATRHGYVVYTVPGGGGGSVVWGQ